MQDEKSHSPEKNTDCSAMITRFMPIIKAKARMLGNNRVENEDLVSEGFLGLLNAVRSYNPEKGDFDAFAYTCIVNKMKSAVLKIRGSSPSEVTANEFDFDRIEDDKPLTEDLVILKEQNSEMYRQIEQLLSPREREVFFLYLSAYSYSQIAQRLDISVKSVDNAITRAKSKLRDFYTDPQQ